MINRREMLQSVVGLGCTALLGKSLAAEATITPCLKVTQPNFGTVNFYKSGRIDKDNFNQLCEYFHQTDDGKRQDQWQDQLWQSTLNIPEKKFLWCGWINYPRIGSSPSLTCFNLLLVKNNFNHYNEEKYMLDYLGGDEQHMIFDYPNRLRFLGKFHSYYCCNTAKAYYLQRYQYKVDIKSWNR